MANQTANILSFVDMFATSYLFIVILLFDLDTVPETGAGI